jgi:hypothetical protein
MTFYSQHLSIGKLLTFQILKIVESSAVCEMLIFLWWCNTISCSSSLWFKWSIWDIILCSLFRYISYHNNICKRWRITILSTIFQLYRGGQFYWWRKPAEYSKKTTDLSQITDFITYCCIEYTSPEWDLISQLHW